VKMIVFSHEEQRQKENRMNKKLQDRVAIVIGSTSGIGQAIAETFAQEGAKVVITGRRQEKGDAIVKELEKQGLQTEFYQIDVTDPAQCKALIEDTVKKHGGLDILVCDSRSPAGSFPVSSASSIRRHRSVRRFLSGKPPTLQNRRRDTDLGSLQSMPAHLPHPKARDNAAWCRDRPRFHIVRQNPAPSSPAKRAVLFQFASVFFSCPW
jgi:hypothetical protein